MSADAAPDAVGFDVDIYGADAAALVCALECARFGFRVRVIPGVERLMPRAFVDVDGTIAQLCNELGVGFRVERVDVPQLDVLGIPVNPFSQHVRQAVGMAGAWRIYADRLKPLLSIGNEVDFGRLVSKRLGESAAQRLVLPRLTELFGLETIHVSVDEVAPGLSQAMSRVGSLTGGALELAMEHDEWMRILTIDAGTRALIEALRARLDYFAVSQVAADDVTSVSAGARITVRDVVISDEFPSWVRQIARARERAGAIRTELLSDPARPPIGPVDLEH